MSIAARFDAPDQAVLIGRFPRHLSPGTVAAVRTLHYDFVPGRRGNVRMWSLDGRVYINCHALGGVSNLCRRSPNIHAPLLVGIERSDVGDNVPLSRPRALLARRLAEQLPGGRR